MFIRLVVVLAVVAVLCCSAIGADPKPLSVSKSVVSELPRYTPEEDASYERGAAAYSQLCHVCHGEDGAGTLIPDDPDERRLAPSLNGSRRVLGRPEYVITALLAGVAGPVDGENYQGQMVSMASYGDAWIADVASYIRTSFDNDASMITSNQVARMRKRLAGRTDSFTVEEILSMMPVALTNHSLWKASASHNSSAAANAIDGIAATAWNSEIPQKPGTWFQIELPEPVMLWDFNFESPGDSLAMTGFPRACKVQVSLDGSQWSNPVAEGQGRGRFTLIPLNPAQARFIRVTLTSDAPEAPPWAISRTQILQAGQLAPATSASLKVNVYE